MSARWWSQPVAAEGSTKSEGIKRQLGKPRLDPLTVLIRETAQNSCDAAVGEGDIDFAVDLKRLSGNLLENWRDFLLPEPVGSGLNIENVFSRDPTVLTVSDRGTTGLGGPLRADAIPQDGERADFVNFIRNVGERKTSTDDLSGGSYGFGKGILYNVSRCNVIVADSVCVYQGKLQRRLIGAALGNSYRTEEKLFTGRHWLSGVDQEGYPIPLLDEEAEEMANSLLLPRFGPGVTGTNVAVVGIDLGSNADSPRDSEEAAKYLLSTMVWNLWPRMLDGHKNRLICSVKRDGFRTEAPNPEELPLLMQFVDAYRQVAEDDGQFESPVRKTRPRDVGRFALRHGMAPPWTDEDLSAAAPFDGRAHHCARMRQADLVVDYVAGEPPANELLQYGAVFRASADANEYFAEAEPPTHDQWVLSGLTGTARGVVQLANSFVREKLKSSGAPPREAIDSDATEPLGHFATQFAGVIAGAEGDSATASVASTTTRTSASGRGTRTRGVKFLVSPGLVFENGEAIIRAELELPANAIGRTAIIEPSIITADGPEQDSGTSSGPVAIGWTSLDGKLTVPGARLDLRSGTPSQWTIRVRPHPDTVTRVTVRLETAQP